MTVEVPNRSFLLLLFKWRGSIWKGVYKKLVIYMFLYTIVNIIYRFALSAKQQKTFEGLVSLTGSWPQAIPLQFILGFFTTYVIGNWWKLLTSLPNPKTFLYVVNIYLPGPENLAIRRTLARWCVLHVVLVFREISVRVKRRFPTDAHLIQNKLITEEEYETYRNTESRRRWFVPVYWCANKLTDLAKEKKLSDQGLEKTTEAVWKLQQSCSSLVLFDWINTPLQYIQLTTFAVYGYFFICLFARQAVKTAVNVPTEPGAQSSPGAKSEQSTADIYIPYVLIIEFIFYAGWLHVSEQSINPFDDDDDDFSMNYILDEIYKASFLIADELSSQAPDFSLASPPPRIRHTLTSYEWRDRPPRWKIENERIYPDEAVMLPVFDHHKEPLPSAYKQSVLQNVTRAGRNLARRVQIPRDESLPSEPETSNHHATEKL